MVPFERFGMVSCLHSIVTVAVSSRFGHNTWTQQPAIYYISAQPESWYSFCCPIGRQTERILNS